MSTSAVQKTTGFPATPRRFMRSKHYILCDQRFYDKVPFTARQFRQISGYEDTTDNFDNSDLGSISVERGGDQNSAV
ncbi:hypothetical protein N7488_000351 [Penicillium malachiteum]|nr:hypothetical protein N7488_000351 [Penicillium malachiteum]